MKNPRVDAALSFALVAAGVCLILALLIMYRYGVYPWPWGTP